MRPIDRAAVTFLTDLKVGHTNTPCRHCGRLIHSGERVTAIARRPRGRSKARRWEAHLFCADCEQDATTTPLAGYDEFATTATVRDGPRNATTTLATVTLANIEVVVYVASRTGIYGLDASTGTRHFELQQESHTNRTPTVEAGTMYVVGPGTLTAYTE